MRNILILIVSSVILVTAISIIIAQSNKSALSDLMLSNIEALAAEPPPVTEEEDSTYPDGEGGAGITCGRYTGKCWSKTSMICFKGEGTYNYCEFVGTANARCNNTCAGY